MKGKITQPSDEPKFRSLDGKVYTLAEMRMIHPAKVHEVLLASILEELRKLSEKIVAKST
jgi:hypothetical protein